jgi:conjugal transfer pilus assembly protein TraB
LCREDTLSSFRRHLFVASAFGTTIIVDSDQAAKYSIGGGVLEGAANLHEFYLDLANQTMMVIEVGAVEKVTTIAS